MFDIPDDRAMDGDQGNCYRFAAFPWTINPMNYPVIIRAESAHRYVAQPLGIPEARVVATTQEEAVAQVTETLGDWLAAAKVIHVAVPGEDADNPWLRTFGRSAADPDLPEFLEELQRQRTDDSPA